VLVALTVSLRDAVCACTSTAYLSSRSCYAVPEVAIVSVDVEQSLKKNER
jgi:hypothetical protein